MKKLIPVFAVLMLFAGCATTQANILEKIPLIGGLFKGGGDTQLVKTGDIAPIKAPIKATAEASVQAPVGYANQANRTNIGRDSKQMNVNNNSSELMASIFKGINNGYTAIIIVILAAWGKREWEFYSLQKQHNKFLCDWIAKGEASQDKYIQTLENLIKGGKS